MTIQMWGAIKISPQGRLRPQKVCLMKAHIENLFWKKHSFQKRNTFRGLCKSYVESKKDNRLWDPRQYWCDVGCGQQNTKGPHRHKGLWTCQTPFLFREEIEILTDQLHSFARATITQHYRLGSLCNRNSFPHCSGGWKCLTKVSAGLFFPESSPLRL